MGTVPQGLNQETPSLWRMGMGLALLASLISWFPSVQLLTTDGPVSLAYTQNITQPTGISLFYMNGSQVYAEFFLFLGMVGAGMIMASGRWLIPILIYQFLLQVSFFFKVESAFAPGDAHLLIVLFVVIAQQVLIPSLGPDNLRLLLIPLFLVYGWIAPLLAIILLFAPLNHLIRIPIICILSYYYADPTWFLFIDTRPHLAHPVNAALLLFGFLCIFLPLPQPVEGKALIYATTQGPRLFPSGYEISRRSAVAYPYRWGQYLARLSPTERVALLDYLGKRGVKGTPDITPLEALQ